MAVAATFHADFSSFIAATQAAETKLADFGKGADRVGTQLNRMIDQFSGRKLIQDAQLMSEAVERIGGVTKLTDAELQRLSGTAAAAAAKMRAMGIDVPPGIQKIADSAKGLNSVLGKDLLGTLTKVASAFGIAFSVQALTRFVGSVFSAASSIHDMSLKIGISSEAVQGFGFAAEQAGSSLDAVGTAITRMNVNLSEGDKGTVAALRQAGLEFSAIRAMKPEDAFLAITDAIAQIPDPMVRSEVALRLFGKSAAELLPAITEGFRGAANAAAKMSNETVDSLERAQDAWSKAGNAFTIVTGTMIAKVIEFWGTLREQNFGLFGVAVKKLRGDIELLPPVIHLTKEEIEALSKAERDAANASETLRNAQEKYADSLRDIVDVLSGGGAIDKASLYMQALADTVDVSRMTVQAQKQLNDVLDDALQAYYALGQQPPQAMLRIWAATITLKTGMLDLGKAIAGVTQQLEQMNLSSTSSGQGLGMQGLADGTREVLEHTEHWADALHNVANAMSIVGDKWSTVAQGILRQTSAIVSLWNGTIDPKTGKVDPKSINKTAAVGMALGAVAEFIPDDTTKGAVTKGAMQGAAVGSVAGPIGMAVGAGVGALIGWYQSGKAARQVNDVRDAFVSTAGGLAALDAKAHAAGVSLTAMLDADTVEEYEAAIANLTNAINFQDQAMQFVTDTMDKYGLSVTDMGQAWSQQALDKQAALLTQEFYALEAAGANVETISNAMSESINEYVQNALAAGTTVPAAMHDILQQMITQGLLLDANGEAFADLEDSGITFAQTMDEQFMTLIETIQALVDAITRGLGGAIAGLPDVAVGVQGPGNGQGWSDMPEINAMARGGMGRVTKPTLFLAGEAGAEDFAFGQFKGGGKGGTVTEFHSHVYLNGQQIAEVVNKENDAKTRARHKMRAA